MKFSFEIFVYNSYLFFVFIHNSVTIPNLNFPVHLYNVHCTYIHILVKQVLVKNEYVPNLTEIVLYYYMHKDIF